MMLPAYIKHGQSFNRALKLAYSVMKHMQRQKLKPPDEVSYTIYTFNTQYTVPYTCYDILKVPYTHNDILKVPYTRYDILKVPNTSLFLQLQLQQI